jgi:hypothetical protein
MPSKTRSSKVKKVQSKSNIPKRKKTKVGKAKRKMKTRGRIVSRKGSKKKLLAYGNNSISAYASPPRYSSELTSEEERARERKALISAIQYHQRQQEKNPAHLWKMRKRDVFNFNE